MTAVAVASSNVRFSKLNDDSWGVSCIPGEHTTGDTVMVRTRKGSYIEVTFGAPSHVDPGAWNQGGPKGRAYFHKTSGKGGSGGGWRDRPISEKQLVFVMKLAVKKGETPDFAKISAMTGGQASDELDRLKALPDAKDKPAPKKKTTKAKAKVKS